MRALVLPAVVLLLLGAGHSLAQEPSVAPGGEAPTVISVKALLDAGRYAEAETQARSLVEQLSANGQTNSLQAAKTLDLLVEALWQGGKSGQPETRALAERAVALKQRLLGPDHPDLVPSLMNLAWVLEDLDQNKAARPLLERVLAIQEKAFGPAHKDLAQTLMNLGLLSRAEGDFPTAREYCQRALALLEQLLGPEHRDVGVTLNALAVLARDTGEHATALSLWERAVKIFEGSLGARHPTTAAVLHNMAAELVAQGRYADARPVYERALSIQESVLGPEHTDVAITLGGLAELVSYLGDYSEAKRLFERGIDIYEKAQTPNRVQSSHVILGLGVQLGLMGDTQGARPLLERAVAIREEALGPDHPAVAVALCALGKLLVDSGDDDQAEAVLNRALTIQEKSLGPNHERVADTLQELGELAMRRGDQTRARQLFERGMTIVERQFGPAHLNLASPLRQLARLAEQDGSIAQARALLERALAIYKQGIGPAHPFAAETEAELAGLLARTGEPRAALDAALETEQISRDHFRLTVRSLGERQALRYAATRAVGVDLAVALLAGSAEAAADRRRAVFDAVIRSRALVLDEMAMRHRAAGTSNDPETARLVAILAKARERLAWIVVRGPRDSPVEHYRRLLGEARGEKERAEEALAARSLAFREEQTRAAAGLDEVQVALPVGAALIAFVRYARGPQALAKEARESDAAGYAAFVLRPGQDPDLVPLGTAAQIESAVTRWRQTIEWEAQAPGVAPRRSLSRYLEAAAALRRLVWDPLALLLAGSETVLIVPDGALHLVSFAALATDDGRFLVETRPLSHVLSAERDLVGRPEGAVGKGLLLMGAPEFASLPARAAVHAFRGATASGATFRNLRFSPLPATKQELEVIKALWKGRQRAHADASQSFVLEGPNADEAAFKDKAPGREILHLATHGFVLGSACAASSGNALVCSGLALAGANRRDTAPSNAEDGILTAEEIAALDLQGVQWAVLSACETGLGEIAAGEGVFGLRRAFQVAGARSVIMSLWPVDDRSTRIWMEYLYRRRLQGGLSTAAAVRAASLDVLRQRRARGEGPHPLYWAGFLAAGDWR